MDPPNRAGQSPDRVVPGSLAGARCHRAIGDPRVKYLQRQVGKGLVVDVAVDFGKVQRLCYDLAHLIAKLCERVGIVRDVTWPVPLFYAVIGQDDMARRA